MSRVLSAAWVIWAALTLPLAAHAQGPGGLGSPAPPGAPTRPIPAPAPQPAPPAPTAPAPTAPAPTAPAPTASEPAAPAPQAQSVPIAPATGSASALRAELARSASAREGALELRTFEDGQRASIPWSEDFSGELTPPGLAHFVFMFGGQVLAADDAFSLAGRGELAMLVDVCLYEHVSVHLRFGAVGGYQSGESHRYVYMESGTVGGRVQVGVHLAQILAIRLGFDLGAALVNKPGALSPVAWGAAHVELGLRVDRVEFGVQCAVVTRAGAAWGAFEPGEAIPVGVSARLGGFIGVTL